MQGNDLSGFRLSVDAVDGAGENPRMPAKKREGAAFLEVDARRGGRGGGGGHGLEGIRILQNGNVVDAGRDLSSFGAGCVIRQSLLTMSRAPRL